MADTKISAMTAVSALDAADVAPVVQGGANKKATIQQIATAITGGTVANGATVTTSQPVINLAQTWNNASTDFSFIEANVTKTLLGGGSTVLNIKMDGVSKLSMDQYGQLNVAGLFTNGGIEAAYQFTMTNGRMQFTNNAAAFSQPMVLSFGVSEFSATPATCISSTSVSGASVLRISGATVADGGTLELIEYGTAPAAGAANTCRIYCEDNGSGKTRLMAKFNTGAAVQIAIQP